MRATRAYLAGIGTAGALVLGAAALFVTASAILAFRAWPSSQVGSPARQVLSVRSPTPRHAIHVAELPPLRTVTRGVSTHATVTRSSTRVTRTTRHAPATVVQTTTQATTAPSSPVGVGTVATPVIHTTHVTHHRTQHPAPVHHPTQTVSSPIELTPAPAPTTTTAATTTAIAATTPTTTTTITTTTRPTITVSTTIAVPSTPVKTIPPPGVRSGNPVIAQETSPLKQTLDLPNANTTGAASDSVTGAVGATAGAAATTAATAARILAGF